MNAQELLADLDRVARPRVLVLGDLILDRYTWGNADRISPEAPVVVLRVDQEETRLGGAANVCHMLRGLDAEVSCCGVVGHDESGLRVHKLLVQAGQFFRFDMMLASQVVNHANALVYPV